MESPTVTHFHDTIIQAWHAVSTLVLPLPNPLIRWQGYFSAGFVPGEPLNSGLGY